MIARRSIAVVLAAQLALAPAAVAFAKEPTKAQMEEARTHLEKGRALYKEGAFEAALVEFERAYELAPSFKLLYNIALVQKQLNDFASALRTFEKYLADGGSDVPDAKRKEVDGEIVLLKSRVGTVAVTVNVDGAEVFLDDVSMGKSPLATSLTVNPGKRKIYATKEGHTQSTKFVTVAGGESAKVALELTSLASTATPPHSDPDKAPPIDQPPPKTTSSNAAIIGWGVTGGLLVGAGVTGFLALRASSNLKDMRESPATRDDLDSAQRKVRIFSVVTDVLLGGALIAGGVSIYLTLDKGSKKTGQGAMRVGIAPSAIVLSGEF